MKMEGGPHFDYWEETTEVGSSTKDILLKINWRRIWAIQQQPEKSTSSKSADPKSVTTIEVQSRVICFGK